MVAKPNTTLQAPEVAITDGPPGSPPAEPENPGATNINAGDVTPGQDLAEVTDVPEPTITDPAVNFDYYRDHRLRRSSMNSSVGDESDIVSPSVGGSSAVHSQSNTTHSKRSSKSGMLIGSKARRRSSENGTAATTDYQTRKSMWSNLVKDDRIWEDDSDEDSGKDVSLWQGMTTVLNNLWITTRMAFHEKIYVLKSHPWIFFVTALTFGGLLAIGLYGVLTLAHEQEKASIDEAQDLAVETGAWFSDALDRTLLPLFTLSQFVQQLDLFATLPEEIGPAFEPGSMPFLPPNDDGEYHHRNTTGTVCSDPEKMAKFADLAATIKRDAKMEGVLVNLQVAPMSVVCLLHPVNNTEDFEPPTFMDNTGAIGHDLLTDPQRKFIAQATVPSEGVVIAGPLTLRQCSDCDATVKTAFIARMAIDALNERQIINVDGIDYKKWGFAVALINWAELVSQSEIDQKFAARGMRYQLTRTDKNFNDETKQFDVKVNVLAGEEDFELDESQYVSVDLDTTNNLWNIKVGYDEGFEPAWLNGAIAITVVGAFVLSFMFMVICIENQTRHDLLREMLPPKALRKIKKGKTCVEKYNIATIFFSDIVGYTTMSAEMSAIQVMKMLNEFYTEVDKIASKHQVYKIQTIGDAYMVTGGVPDRCLGPEGARKVALFAIETMDFAENFRTSDGAKVIIRAGINSGPVVAGVVGTKRPQYTVFGDTVNAAARMESTSEKMRIQCTDMTYRLLRDSTTHIFDLENRGGVEVKGKGTMNTWFINGVKPNDNVPPCKNEESTEENDNEGDLHLYDDLEQM